MFCTFIYVVVLRGVREERLRLYLYHCFKQFHHFSCHFLVHTPMQVPAKIPDCAFSWNGLGAGETSQSDSSSTALFGQRLQDITTTTLGFNLDNGVVQWSRRWFKGEQ